MQLAGNLARGAGLRAGIAPAHARSVIRTYLGCLSHLLLDQVPVERCATKPGLQYHNWASSAGTLYVQTVATHVNEPAGGWISLCVPSCGNCFVAGPNQSQAHNQGEYHAHSANQA